MTVALDRRPHSATRRRRDFSASPTAEPPARRAEGIVPGNYHENEQHSFSTELAPGDVGLDKVRLKVGVSRESGKKLMQVQARNRPRPELGTPPVGFGTFTALAYPVESGFAANIEFNPARVLDPEGWSLAPVGALPAALDLIWPRLEAQLGVVTTRGQAHVRRLDVARDFHDVTQGFQHLTRLYLEALTPKTLRATSLTSHDGGVTLQLWNKSGGKVRLYDKHRESDRRAPPGTIRFEVEARGWLEHYGNSITVVDDVTPNAAAKLLTERWEATKMGLPVIAPDFFNAELWRVIQQRGHGPTLYFSIQGYAKSLAEGSVPDGALPTGPTRSKWNTILEEVGTLPHALVEDEHPLSSRLDLVSGTQVISPALVDTSLGSAGSP